MIQDHDRILRWPQVQEKTGQSRATAWRQTRAGTFPAPFALSPTGRAIGWSERAVDAWIAERIKSGRRPRPPARTGATVSEDHQQAE
jgi:prophage regulatory protein